MTDSKILDELPFYNVTTNELVHIFSPSVTDSLEDNNFCNFIKSISDTVLLQNFNFNYVTTEEFSKIDYRSDSTIELSLLHLNIHSLNKNNMALYHLLDLLNYEFDVIVLSEGWSCNIDLYRNFLAGYDF